MSHRFFYQNMLGPGTPLAAASVAEGFVGGAVPRVANGSGQVIFTGAYAGADQEVYTVEIMAAGEAGAATFRWRKSATAAGQWEASGVPTSATDTALDGGVKVRFQNGASAPSFQAGDRWQATGARFRAPEKVHDLDPNTRLRSAAPPEDPWYLTADLTAAQAPDALIVYGHNISAGATVKVQANSADTWTAPPLSETVAWRAGTMVHYLATTPRAYRHWRLLVEGDAANPDGHVEIAEVYLGGYFEPAYSFGFGNVLGEEAFEEERETESRVARTVLLNRGRSARLPYRHVSAAQRALFLAMFQSVKDLASERSKPLFVHLDVDDPASILFATLLGRFEPGQEGPDDFAFELELRERLS